MPTAAQKAAATKRAAANKAKSNGAGDGPSKRELGRARDLELAPKIKAARDAGKSWDEIKDELGVDQPKGQVLIKMAALRPKDRIKFTDDDESNATLVVEARDEQELSWADIAVRAGVSMGKVKALYASTGADPAESRVGRAAEPATKPAAKKGAGTRPANKAPARKAPAKGKTPPAKRTGKRPAGNRSAQG